MLEDSQAYGGNTRNVTDTAFTSLPVTAFTFPDSRQISNTYDLLYRRSLVEETSGGADIAAWQFFGPGRLAEVVLGNGAIVTWMNNDRTRSAIQEDLSTPSWGNQSSDRLGYDGAGRMIAKRVLNGGVNGGTFAYNNTSAVVGWTTEFDKAGNKNYERMLHTESRSHLYFYVKDGDPRDGYDSLNRLRQYQRGVLATGGEMVSPTISLPNTDKVRQYELDGLGNWKKSIFVPVGGSSTTEVRQHNHLNEITRTRIASTTTDFAYDGSAGASNGNLTNDGVRTYEWDALNRLKVVNKTPSSPVPIGEYTYDALGRRVRKVMHNGGLSGTITNATSDYVYNTQWQCVEERNGSNNPTKQYVWGVYIDELIQLNLLDPPVLTAGMFYPLQDLLYRTQALTDDAGDLVEAYDHDAYGNTLIFDAPGTGSDWWANDATQTKVPNCEALFTGQRYDAESELYQYRARFYDHLSGRFISRDPLLDNLGGGLHDFVGSQPSVLLDPMGLRKCGIRVRILTGDWCVDDNVWEAAWNAYSQTAYDRTNETLDFLTANNVDLEGYHGGRQDDKAYTFDKSQRERGECFARCWAAKTIDALTMGIASESKIPGISLISALPINPASGYFGYGFIDTGTAWQGQIGVEAFARPVTVASQFVGRGPGWWWQIVDNMLTSGVVAEIPWEGIDPNSPLGQRLRELRLRRLMAMRRLRRFRKTLGKVGVGMQGLALVINLKQCYDECEKCSNYPYCTLGDRLLSLVD